MANLKTTEQRNPSNRVYLFKYLRCLFTLLLRINKLHVMNVKLLTGHIF
jgi:hypothetical protein